MPTTPYPARLEMSRHVSAMFDNDGGDVRVIVDRVQRGASVASVDLVPNWSLNGANTNYRTFRLVNRGSNGLGATVVATLDLTSGVNLTACVAKAIPVTAANAVVAIGDVLEWQSIHAGSGLPDPGGLVIVQFGSTTF